MSQLVVCRNNNGIVLAADSKALEFVPPETISETEITRLVQLDRKQRYSRVALLTAFGCAKD